MVTSILVLAGRGYLLCRRCMLAFALWACSWRLFPQQRRGLLTTFEHRTKAHLHDPSSRRRSLAPGSLRPAPGAPRTAAGLLERSSFSFGEFLVGAALSALNTYTSLQPVQR